jgi:hypothetical protein
MKFQYISAFLLTQVVSSAAFTPGNARSSTSTSRSSSSLNAIPTPEESAKALTAYMAKSHEAKITALKTLEDKKNTEIASLRAQMGNSNTAIVPAPAAAAASGGDVKLLSEKLVKYQVFMAEYIIKAQEEKAKAVKEAEIAIAKKYEDKLNAFMLNPAAGTSAATEEPSLYKERNANIAAAANAGTSRWGNKEVERAGATAPPSKLLKAIAPINVATVGDAVPEEVTAADHGLRADGGVGGLSLAERVKNGAAPAAAATSVVLSSNPNYEKRNARIAAAAKSGNQSRWGSREVDKAIEYSANVLPASKAVNIVVLPEVEAADHGLRADGGVSGPSLAERVNLGARLLQQ